MGAGVSALFSTAYRKGGFSIYCALEVTALFALGLTPAVFVFTGKIAYLVPIQVVGAAWGFAHAHSLVIAVRVILPNVERPCRIGDNISTRGGLIPLTAPSGAIGTLAVWPVIVYTRGGRWIDLAWVLISIATYTTTLVLLFVDVWISTRRGGLRIAG